MRKILLLILPLFLLACSAPKYTYYFDHYDYSTGKKSQVKNNPPDKVKESIFQLQDDLLLADGSSHIVLKDERPPSTSLNTASRSVKTETGNSVNKISKQERRDLRREIKKQLKSSNDDVRLNDNNAEAMDKDLKLAIIFGAVGLTLSLFAGVNTAFWVLGVIAIVVGVVFLIRWLLRQ
jgi:hypothetical protein